MSLHARLATIAILGALSIPSTAFSRQSPPAPPAQGAGEAATATTSDIVRVEIPIPEGIDYPALLGLLSGSFVEASILPGSLSGPTSNGSVLLRGRPESIERAAGAVRMFLQTNARPTEERTVTVRVSSTESLLTMLANLRGAVSARMSILPDSSRDTADVLIVGQPDDVAAAERALKELLANGEELEKARLAELERDTVTIQFPGGTVESFVAAVSGKFGLVPPLYPDDSVRSLRVPPVEMRQVDLAAALRVLERVAPTDASGFPVPLSISLTDGATSWTNSNLNRMVDRIARSVVVIERKAASPWSTPNVSRAAFVLGDAEIDRARLDATLDAVALAVNLNGASPTFRAKFHAPSNVLVLEGTHDELGLAAQVIKGKFPDASVDLPRRTQSQPGQESEPATSSASPPPQSERPTNRKLAPR